MAGVFLLSAERWQAGCGICVFVCAACVGSQGVDVLGGYSLGALIVCAFYLAFEPAACKFVVFTCAMFCYVLLQCCGQ